MGKPIGTFQCVLCDEKCDGSELFQDPKSTATRWTCSKAFCGGNVRKISDEPFVRTTTKKGAIILGDISNPQVRELLAMLKQDGIPCLMLENEDTTIENAILCYTETEFSQTVWRWLGAHRSAMLFPVLFENGQIPAIYAGIKYANFTDQARILEEYSKLLIALQKYLG